jgi:hypothetical protein
MSLYCRLYTLSTTRLQCRKDGHSNTCEIVEGSILCGCIVTDTKHMAFNSQKFVVVNVFDTEVQTGNDINCSEELHNDKENIMLFNEFSQ